MSYDPATGSPKQRLDLYMPTPGPRRWPAVVFIHGGSWTSGDRSLEVGGADVYGNIGRFLAQHGYGTAVISYRLIPSVDWLTQAEDVAKAALVIYAGGETRALQRQSQLFVEALTRAGETPTVIVAPGLSHTRIVPTLSRDDRAAGAGVLAFLRSTVEP